MNQSKKILFVYDYLYTGGIETLILRMANWLCSQGYEVSMLLRKKGEIASHFDDRIQFIELGKIYRLLYLPMISNLVLKKHNLEQFDYVMSFHPRSNWIASNIIDNLKLECKYITGVYHPRAYFNKDLHLSEKLCYKYLLTNQNNKSIIFMNEENREHHAKNLNTNFTNSIIWPLPVEDRKIENRVPTKYKFVSIGRFAKFKTYNLYMIDIVKKLLDEGYDITYDIYGTGELQKNMKKKIKEYSLEKSVFLKGNLDYSKFSQTLENAYLFIGMGTSVVESSFCKVPSIVSIENSKEDVSYGFLHDLPYYNVGEKNDALKEKKVIDLIRETLLLKDDQYNQLCDTSYKYVQSYSMSSLMPKWINQLNELDSNTIKISFSYKILYFALELINPLLKVFKRKNIT